ncbi:MAG: hypothetical protein V7K90_01885 [Nostoc sp.]|uniref:hypothetical protein n=1 Tax=Nostoc sp. TaxID=1180 RepID=UPI002FF86EBF
MRYTRRGTALPCPYTSQYNVVPHLNGNRYKLNYFSVASAIERDVTASILVQWLQWLNQA